MVWSERLYCLFLVASYALLYRLARKLTAASTATITMMYTAMYAVYLVWRAFIQLAAMLRPPPQRFHRSRSQKESEENHAQVKNHVLRVEQTFGEVVEVS